MDLATKKLSGNVNLKLALGETMGQERGGKMKPFKLFFIIDTRTQMRYTWGGDVVFGNIYME